MIFFIASYRTNISAPPACKWYGTVKWKEQGFCCQKDVGSNPHPSLTSCGILTRLPNFSETHTPHKKTVSLSRWEQYMCEDLWGLKTVADTWHRNQPMFPMTFQTEWPNWLPGLKGTHTTTTTTAPNNTNRKISSCSSPACGWEVVLEPQWKVLCPCLSSLFLRL